MKKEEKQTKNPFLGKWKIVRTEIYTDQGWKWIGDEETRQFIWLPENDVNQGLIWEFTEEKVMFSKGKLIEYRNKKEISKTSYSYCPNEKILYIDRSDYRKDGFLNICYEDKYRIESAGNDQLYLYDLKDVEKEPENYTSRILILQECPI